MGKIITRVQLPQIPIRTLYRQLGFTGTKIPADARKSVSVQLEDWNGKPFPLPPVTVTVFPTGEANRALHRVVIHCPQCGDEIPFGRFGSHYTSRRCDYLKSIYDNRIKDWPKNVERIYRVGKCDKGYVVIEFRRTGFHGFRCRLNGGYVRQFGLAYTDPHHSLLYSSPVAFCDWVQEYPTLVNDSIRKMEPHFRRSANCFADIGEDDYAFLTELVAQELEAKRNGTYVLATAEWFNEREREAIRRFPWLG